MELQGKVIAVMPERGGISQRGTEWKVQEYVIETHDQYQRKMVFEVFGADRIQRFNIQIGQEVLVAFDIDAREWNGRWFNSIRAFDVRPADPATMGMAQNAAPATQQAVPTSVTQSIQPESQEGAVSTNDDNPEDLPF